MDAADYRLRNRCARCVGPVAVHRAEVVARPGRLVRLTRVTGAATAAKAEALATAWQGVPHAALLPIDRITRDPDGVQLEGPGASARPLDTVAAGTSVLTPVEVARSGARIAAGLAALHEHGIVHGAVSAHTILLGTDAGAVLDGPWHAGCLADRDGADIEVADDASTAATHATADVRALAITLLELLATVEERDASVHDVAALRSLLEEHVRAPEGAHGLQHTLATWQATATQDPVTTSGTAARGARREPGSQPPPSRRRGGRVGVRGGTRVRIGLGVGAAVVLAVALALAVARDGSSPPVTDALASPSTGTTSASALPLPEDAATSTPAPRPARAEPSSPATRRVCPAAAPPPGHGRLVLADLEGRGCRSAVRIDGARLVVPAGGGTLVEVELDLEPSDQVLIADLEGAGRDDVIVYRPRTGEVFRFAALAGPGEAVTAIGQASGWVGGSATIGLARDGTDELQVRDGTPA